ncbi:MAG: TlpA family protein disulfide reductase [Myxococcales bacterium]|nr:TlpA family protein disulfide reductase [Myxococcales bacterium]
MLRRALWAVPLALGCPAHRVALLVLPSPPELRAPPPPPSAEETARFETITVDYMRGDAIGALEKIRAFDIEYPNSVGRGMLADWTAALALVGRSPPSLQGVRWFAAAGAYDEHRVTLVAFFEPWCPHCRVELPKLELARRDFEASGFGVIGLTRLSRGSTDADLAAMIEAGFLRFPIAIEDGTVTEDFGVTGVPFLVLVRDGLVAWAGHPELVTVDLIAGLLSAAALPFPREGLPPSGP